jgi:hypothetical protein
MYNAHSNGMSFLVKLGLIIGIALGGAIAVRTIAFKHPSPTVAKTVIPKIVVPADIKEEYEAYANIQTQKDFIEKVKSSTEYSQSKKDFLIGNSYKIISLSNDLIGIKHSYAKELWEHDAKHTDGVTSDNDIRLYVYIQELKRLNTFPTLVKDQLDRKDYLTKMIASLKSKEVTPQGDQFDAMVKAAVAKSEANK